MGEVIDFKTYAVTGLITGSPETNNDGPDELEHAFNESLVEVFKKAYNQYLVHTAAFGRDRDIAEWYVLIGALLLMEELKETAIVDLLKAELDRIRNAG